LLAFSGVQNFLTMGVSYKNQELLTLSEHLFSCYSSFQMSVYCCVFVFCLRPEACVCKIASVSDSRNLLAVMKAGGLAP
jgi:hypothetical protein